jgi:nucleotide-binding universal stress UspA family protein
MKWVVGVDCGGSSRGALQLARWLAGASEAGFRESFVPVHVLDGEHLRAMLRVHHLDEVVEAARAAARRQVAEASVGTAPPEVEIVQAPTIAEGLEAALARSGAHGVIVGRAGGGARHRLVRLGRVTRRVLAALRCPVLVVPHDVEAWRLGDGPIVALSSFAPGSLEACRVAGDLARATGRALAIAHVVPERRHALAPRGEPDAAAGEADAGTRQSLERWLRYHGVAPQSAAVLQGDVVRAAERFAGERDAPLVVVGTRPRTASGTRLARGIARQLAALAHVPVAITPSPR